MVSGASAEVRDEDRELARSVAAGDEDAFRRIVARYDRGLQRMARIYVGAAHVEDVVQETWIAVLRGIDGFEARSSLRTWVFGILVRIARRRAEREGRTIPFAPAGHGGDNYTGAVDIERLHHPELGTGYWPVEPAFSRDPELDLLAREAREVITRAVAALPGARREVITLRDLEGWSATEVCELLGISDVNQRTLLHRARVAVRSTLEEYLDE